MADDMQDLNNQGRSNMTAILVGLMLIVLLTMGGLIAYRFLNSSGSEKRYTEYLTSAEHYVASQDYAQAIISLRNAINENSSDYRAYYELAKVYELQGDIDSGIHILELGYNRTQSRTLAQYLDELQFRISSDVVNSTSATEYVPVNENKSEIEARETYLDESIINIVSSNTLDGFTRLYGPGEILAKQSDGFVPVYYSNQSFTAYYRNSADNPNAIGSNGRPIFNAYPEMICFDKAALVFKYFDTSLSMKKLVTISGKSLQIREDESSNHYVVFAYSDITVRLYCDENGTVREDDLAWLYLPPHVLSEKALYKGQVVDAATGRGLSGVSCAFSGNGSYTVSTDSNGFFSVELDPGSWNLRLTKNGYMEVGDSFTLSSGEINSDNAYIMSENLQTGQIRIVLSWGAMPSDLDSHLEGTFDNGGTFHVYFSNKRAYNSNNGNAIELDVDDTTGYGPETITINDLEGVYDYYVVDFRSEGTMGALGEAKVTVFMPDGSSQVITINPNCINGWYVLHIDHGNVSVINEVLQ